MSRYLILICLESILSFMILSVYHILLQKNLLPDCLGLKLSEIKKRKKKKKVHYRNYIFPVNPGGIVFLLATL